jgi:hypothetical protein
MSRREQAVVRLVARLKLVSHRQVAQTLAAQSATSANSQARDLRRLLAKLTAAGLLARLERRVGGARAGSAGFIYYLGPLGQRLVAYWRGEGLVRGRRRPEPGQRFVDHRLAVSQLYIDLLLAERIGALALASFDAEPDCWRPYIDRFGSQAVLKPDAYAHTDIRSFEHHWFFEVDLGTESTTVLGSKVQTYWDYFRAGDEQAAHGVFPKVVFATNGEVRRQRIVEVCGRLPEEAWALFAVTTLDKVIDLVLGRGGGGRDVLDRRLMPLKLEGADAS